MRMIRWLACISISLATDPTLRESARWSSKAAPWYPSPPSSPAMPLASLLRLAHCAPEPPPWPLDSLQSRFQLLSRNGSFVHRGHSFLFRRVGFLNRSGGLLYRCGSFEMLVLPLNWTSLADFLPLEPPFVTFEAMGLHAFFVCLFCLGLLLAGVDDFSSVVVCWSCGLAGRATSDRGGCRSCLVWDFGHRAWWQELGKL